MMSLEHLIVPESERERQRETERPMEEREEQRDGEGKGEDRRELRRQWWRLGKDTQEPTRKSLPVAKAGMI